MSGNLEIKSVEAILVLAKTQIENKKYWCQGSLARTEEGIPTNVLNENAYSFCSIGAL